MKYCKSHTYHHGVGNRVPRISGSRNIFPSDEKEIGIERDEGKRERDRDRDRDRESKRQSKRQREGKIGRYIEREREKEKKRGMRERDR